MLFGPSACGAKRPASADLASGHCIPLVLDQRECHLIATLGGSSVSKKVIMLLPKDETTMRSNPLEELESLLDQFDQDLAVQTGTAAPVDLIEHDDEYRAIIDLPGYDTDDIDVTYSDGRLVVAGERTDTVEATDDQYIRRERRTKSVNQTVTLPGPVVDDEITATYDAGVLTVHLPKADPDDDGREIDIE